MNKELYLKLKTIFESYDFDNEANFYALYKYARKAQLNFYFKQFCEYARDMGVMSIVTRHGSTVKRTLIYNRKADKYIKTVFPEFETCPNCQGSGIVQISLS